MEAIFLQGTRQLVQTRHTIGGLAESQHEPRSLGKCRKLRRRTGWGMSTKRFATLRARDFTDPRKQQPQVIDQFCRRADRGAVRSADADLVIHGNRRWNPVDPFRRRLGNPLQKLTRVGRKTLDVAPLAFGEKRIQRQAGLAAAAYAANHHQLTVRDVEVDVLQIVNRDTAEFDMIRWQARPPR